MIEDALYSLSLRFLFNIDDKFYLQEMLSVTFRKTIAVIVLNGFLYMRVADD